MKVSELREKLLELGLSPEQINELKGKAELMKAYEVLSPDLVNSLEEILENPVEKEIEEIVYASPEWAEYVMSQFLPSETDEKGHPKIAGLRRVTNLVLGAIISSGPKQLWPATDPSNPGRASAIVEIVIDWGNSGNIRNFSAAAGAWFENTDDEFALFPEAMAETRAEARALRKALGLATVSADETTSKDPGEIIDKYKKDDGTSITDSQIKAIQVMCDRLNINLDLLTNTKDLTNLSKDEASSILKQLNRYQTNNIEIPQELKNETVS